MNVHAMQVTHAPELTEARYSIKIHESENFDFALYQVSCNVNAWELFVYS